jgi:NAD-dependent dihydropyrimidine dehydrogenase PreA subunit
MVKILIDHAKCGKSADRICVEICPFTIFRDDVSKKLKVVNEENCTQCRICEVNCPSQAIKISA